jgi:hypothetical protein
MHDTPLGWILYLEDLERQATRLRRPRKPAPARPRLREALAALLERLRGLAAAMRNRPAGATTGRG